MILDRLGSLLLAVVLVCESLVALIPACEAVAADRIPVFASRPASYAEQAGTQAVRLDARRALWCSDHLRRLYGFTSGPIQGEDGAWYQIVPEGMGLPAGTRILLVRLPDSPAPGPEDEAAVWDTLARPYPVGNGGRYPGVGFDPGRLRNQTLLKALYGQNEGAVRKHLRDFDLLGQRFRFADRHGAYQALQCALHKVRKHLASHPEDAVWVSPSPGTFAWRTIQGSNRLSAHSFGIAIDLNADKGLYWQWKPDPALLEATRRAFPQAIVDAFEREGFIWGGKWDAFDFMHFEYRPELFVPVPEELLGEAVGADR